MKYLKLMALLIVAIFTFGTAEAQVRVTVGPYYHHGRHWAHRAPYWRHHHRYYRYY